MHLVLSIIALLLSIAALCLSIYRYTIISKILELQKTELDNAIKEEKDKNKQE